MKDALVKACPLEKAAPRGRWMSNFSWELVRARAVMKSSRRWFGIQWRRAILRPVFAAWSEKPFRVRSVDWRRLATRAVVPVVSNFLLPQPIEVLRERPALRGQAERHSRRLQRGLLMGGSLCRR